MELLAPAGDLKKLKYAIHYGADAVYCGIPKFSLRGKRVNKFKRTDLQEGIEYAHKKSKKVYLTLNLYPHNQKLEEIRKYLPEIKKLNPDAVIVSDPGVLSLIKEKLPKMEIHLSTQANCINYGSARFWYKQGVKRIILARETTLTEIEEIHKKASEVELECFVHGAMCMAYSGRCMLSSWINGQSANEGNCVQPCRWPWMISESRQGGRKERSKKMILEEDDGETYLFNSKDLCLIEHLDELKKAGVKSLKIEGRNKTLYYLTTVVKYYRRMLDAKKQDKEIILKEALEEFQKLGNREYTKGFLFGEDKKIQNYKDSRNLSEWEMVGEIVRENPYKGLKEKGFYPVFVHNAIYKGEKIDAIYKDEIKQIKVLEILNKKGEKKDSAHGGIKDLWYIKFDNKTSDWAVLRKKKH